MTGHSGTFLFLYTGTGGLAPHPLGLRNVQALSSCNHMLRAHCPYAVMHLPKMRDLRDVPFNNLLVQVASVER